MPLRLIRRAQKDLAAAMADTRRRTPCLRELTQDVLNGEIVVDIDDDQATDVGHADAVLFHCAKPTGGPVPHNFIY